MGSMERETPVSTVFVHQNGLIEWRYKQGAVVTLEKAQKEVQLISEMFSEMKLEHSFLQIDIRGIKKIYRGARQLFASREISEGYSVQALALLMGSPLSTFIGNFWFAINRPLHPTRLFSDDDRAREWLEERIDAA